MDAITTREFFQEFSDDNLALLYDGSINDDITDKIIALSEYNITHYKELKKSKKRVSFLMAECFQNIIRHGEKMQVDKVRGGEPGFFLTRNFDNAFFITSGNIIKNERIVKLKGQLDKLNKLSRDEIKELFRKVLEDGEISDKGGAGLGLIDMARRSGQKFDYIFKEYNDQLSLFYNQLILKAVDDEVENPGNKLFTIAKAVSYHDKMIDRNILIVHKGDFSQDSILPVLNIIEKNLHEVFQHSLAKKEIYHVIVELLQNVSKHCTLVDGIKEGIFIIGKSNGNFIMSTGNFIEKENIPELKAHIEKLNKMEKTELKELYLSILKEGALSQKGGAGLGLIEISRRRKKPLDYCFDDIFDDKHFFGISVVI
jgi:Family of unknown function (DUF6272)